MIKCHHALFSVIMEVERETILFFGESEEELP